MRIMSKKSAMWIKYEAYKSVNGNLSTLSLSLVINILTNMSEKNIKCKISALLQLY
jgi:hypothetical protein